MRLIEATDRHFAWMLGETRRMGMLYLPPGGIGERDLLEMLRSDAARLRLAGWRGYWMGVAGQEAVGLCGYKRLPDEAGAVDFGYGIAASRSGRGHGTAMVAALVRRARRDTALRTLIAETTPDNLASHRILERNGFVHDGHRLDHDDGPLIVWRRELTDRRFSFAGFKKKPAQGGLVRAKS